MSKQILTILNTGPQKDKELTITQFKGLGKEQLYQLSQGLALGPDDPGFIQVDARTALLVSRMLLKFAQEVALTKVEEIDQLIAEHEEAKATVFAEAKAVSRYLTDIDAAGIPAMLLLGKAEVVNHELSQ